MTELTTLTRLLLEIVRESNGKWDTRNLDYMFHSRSGGIEIPVLHELRDLERRGLVTETTVEGGTGPGWTLISQGTQAIA